MISVCLTTYNSSKYILEQINSITSQLAEGDEVVVSDDGSTDDTVEKIVSLQDVRIRIYVNEGEHGYTSNFENALKKAKGDFIFLSDHDDVWKPNKVSECMKWLKDYDYVVSDAIVTDEKLELLFPSYYQQRKIYRSWIGNIYRFGFLGCLHAFRRCVLTMALPFPQNHLYCTHDNWLFMVGKTFYKVKIIDAPLIYYRRHSGTSSQGGENEHKPFSFRVAYRMYLIYHLVKRAISHNRKINDK